MKNRQDTHGKPMGNPWDVQMVDVDAKLSRNFIFAEEAVGLMMMRSTELTWETKRFLEEHDIFAVAWILKCLKRSM